MESFSCQYHLQGGEVLSKQIKVMVPATTANLGAGFDCLGMALDMWNGFEFELGTWGFSVIGEGASTLQQDGGQLVYDAWAKAFAHRGEAPPPVRLHIESLVPLGRGLGSSATAVVAGLYAANLLGGLGIGEAELLTLAASIEGHPDNVAPALFGGLVVSSGQGNGVDYVVLPAPEELRVVLAIPDFELSTAKARRVLPETVSHGDAVFNTGRAALFVAAWMMRKWDKIRRAMEDRLHQPYRAPLVPGLEAVMDAAKQAGALGAALSGAGPTVVALAKDQTDDIGDAMEEAFAVHGIQCKIMLTCVAEQGTCVAN